MLAAPTIAVWPQMKIAAAGDNEEAAVGHRDLPDDDDSDGNGGGDDDEGQRLGQRHCG